MTQGKKGVNTLGGKRRLLQWGATLLVLTLPLIRLGGESLVRLDIGTRTLFFFGGELRITEFSLLLLATLLLVFVFLILTMVLGRVWCGWLCPQTTLTDLVEWVERTVAAGTKMRGAREIVRHLACALISFVVAGNLLWYFIPAGTFFRRLFSGELGGVASGSLITVWVVVYLDLTLVRRLFCKAVCPYGRLQFCTMDATTLTLEFAPSEKESCIRCGACVTKCPMGIDIKDGPQVECINCGRCLDACRQVMGARGKEGLIRYRFGAGDTRGARGTKLWPLLALVLLLSLLLAVGIATRREATLKVQHAAHPMGRKLSDGALINFYTAYVENRGTAPERFTLVLAPVAGVRAEILGPVEDLLIPANGNRKVDFVVKVTPEPAQKELELKLVRRGETLAAALLPLLRAR